MTSSLNPIDGFEPNLAGSMPWWLGLKIVQMMELTPRGAEGGAQMWKLAILL